MKIRFCTLFGSLAAAVFMALSSPSANAGAFIKFDGVDGEAIDSNHSKWSDLLSFSYNIERDTSTGGGGTIKIGDISCMKELDKASPKMAESLLIGRVFNTVQINVTKMVAGKEEVYLQIELKNGLINSNRVSVDTGVSDRGAEQLTFNYDEIKVTYRSFDAGGKPTGDVVYAWDVKKGEVPGGGA